MRNHQFRCRGCAWTNIWFLIIQALDCWSSFLGSSVQDHLQIPTACYCPTDWLATVTPFRLLGMDSVRLHPAAPKTCTLLRKCDYERTGEKFSGVAWLQYWRRHLSKREQKPSAASIFQQVLSTRSWFLACSSSCCSSLFPFLLSFSLGMARWGEGERHDVPGIRRHRESGIFECFLSAVHVEHLKNSYR